MSFFSFSGSEVDLSDKLGRTPLHYAASFVHADLMSVLLNKGCTVDKQDTNGCTPLHYAAAAKYEDHLYVFLIQFNYSVVYSLMKFDPVYLGLLLPVFSVLSC